MNIQTTNFISRIAGYAADRMASNAFTLKQAREYVAQNMNADTTEYVHVEGVDFEAVRHALHVLPLCSRKAAFAQEVSAIVRAMNKAREENATATRAEYTIKRAASEGLTVTAAQVLATSAARKNVYFSVSAAIAELKEEATKPVATPKKGFVSLKKSILSALVVVSALSCFTPTAHAADQWSAIFGDVQNALTDPNGPDYTRAQDILTRRMGQTFSIGQIKDLAGWISDRSITQYDINDDVINKLGNSQVNKNTIAAVALTAATVTAPAHAISNSDLNIAANSAVRNIVDSQTPAQNYQTFSQRLTTVARDSAFGSVTTQDIQRAARQAGFTFDATGKVISDKYTPATPVVVTTGWTALTASTPAPVAVPPQPVVKTPAVSPAAYRSLVTQAQIKTTPSAQGVTAPVAAPAYQQKVVAPVAPTVAATTQATPVAQPMTAKAPVAPVAQPQAIPVANNAPVVPVAPAAVAQSAPTIQAQAVNIPATPVNATPTAKPVAQPVPVAAPAAKAPALVVASPVAAPAIPVAAPAQVPTVKTTTTPVATPVAPQTAPQQVPVAKAIPTATPVAPVTAPQQVPSQVKAPATPVNVPTAQPQKVPTYTKPAVAVPVVPAQTTQTAPTLTKAVPVVPVQKVPTLQTPAVKTPAITGTSYRNAVTQAQAKTTGPAPIQPTAKPATTTQVVKAATTGAALATKAGSKATTATKAAPTATATTTAPAKAGTTVNIYYGELNVKQDISVAASNAIRSTAAQTAQNTQAISKLNNSFNNLKNQVDTNRKEANAGTASAIAFASQPQVKTGDNFMVSAGTGTYNGESALSVGASFNAGEHTVIKVGVTADTQSNYGAGAGIGFSY